MMALEKYKKIISNLFKEKFGKDFRELSVSEELVELSHSVGETPEEFMHWFKSVESEWWVARAISKSA